MQEEELPAEAQETLVIVAIELVQVPDDSSLDPDID